MAKLTTTFTGDTRSIERSLAKLQGDVGRVNERIAKGNRANAASMRSLRSEIDGIGGSFGSLGQTISRFSGVFAGAFAATEVIRLADTFTQFEAKLINAKVASADMASVQQQLFNAANANGTEVTALADLYGNLAMSAKSVGLTQSQMMLATEGVAASMRLSGATTAQSSATILQLGQALAGGTVRAEEYNSMLENAPALVRAVAESSSQWGGDLGKLRAEINAGTVTSKEWAEAIVAASTKLKNDAANAPLTVAASMQILENNIVQFIGKADDALGASDKLSWALKTLGENLDTLGSIAIVVAAALVARMIPALLATGNSAAGSAGKLLAFQIAMQRAMTGSGTAMATASLGAAKLRGALGALSSFMGGPLGIAISAVVAGIVLFNSSQAELERRTKELPTAFSETESKINDYKNAQIEAASKTGDAAKASLARAEALRIEANALIALRAVETQLAIDRATITQRDAQQRRAQANNGRADRYGSKGGMEMQNGMEAAAASTERLARQQREAANLMIRGLTNLRNKQNAPPERPAQSPSVTPTRTGTGGGGGTSGPTPPTAAELARNDQQAVQAAQDTLRQAMAALATTTQDRLKYQLEGIKIDAERERQNIITQLAEGQISEAAAKEAATAINSAEVAQNDLANREARAETEAKIKALADLRLQDDQTLAALNDAYLADLASMADTLDERQRIEREALANRQKAEKESFDAQQASTAAEWRLAGVLEDEIERRQRASKAAFDRQQTSQTQAQTADQARATPLGAYAEGLKDVNTALENVKAEGLKGLEDGLVDVLTGAGDLKTVFSDLAKSIISDLARVAIQQAIMRPLTDWMTGGKGGGSAADTISTGTNWISKISSIFKFGRNAGGTNNWGGGLSLVGEGGPELLNLPKGSQVMGHNALKSALSAPKASARSAPVFNINTSVVANDSVVLSQLKDYVQQANIQAVQAARQMSMADSQHRARNRLR